MEITKETIRSVRDGLGLSRQKFGDLVGYSANMIYKVEKGLRSIPGPMRLLVMGLIKQSPREEG